MSKILVTGGAGFIGSHIVDALLADSHEILVLDDLSSGSKENLPEAVSFIEQDISKPEVAEAIKNFQPEIIVHTAAQISVSVSMKDPVQDVNVNLCGLMNILNSLDTEKLPYFIFISTGGALYGEQDVFPAAEDHPIRPTSVYGQSKYASELYLDLWNRVYGLESGILRLANVYGPRQNPHGEAGVIAIFSNMLLAGTQPKIFGTGEFTRDYIYVADVVKAVQALIKTSKHNAFNIGTGKETSVNDLYAYLLQASGLDIEPEYKPQRAGDQARSVIDASKAETELAWQPKVELKDGLEKTFQWFRDNK